MKLVIEIPDRLIKKVKDHYVNPYEVDEICEAILDGKPLPEHHGDLKDADELLEMAYQVYDEVRHMWTQDFVVNADDISSAPTIIERSDSE